MEKRFIGVKDLAVYLGLSEDTIRKWVQRGRIPFSKFGKAVRFDLQKMEVWIKRNSYDFKDGIMKKLE